MAYVILISKFCTKLIGGSDGAFDAFTDGISVGKKYDGDKACVGR